MYYIHLLNNYHYYNNNNDNFIYGIYFKTYIQVFITY